MDDHTNQSIPCLPPLYDRELNHTFVQGLTGTKLSNVIYP